MTDVIVGKGKLDGKGVYANRDFRRGEVVLQYHLIPLSQQEFEQLSEGEQMFTHVHWGRIYLCSVPERYVNHSDNPNTYQDLMKKQDIALRDIQKGDMITCDAAKDDVDSKQV